MSVPDPELVSTLAALALDAKDPPELKYFNPRSFSYQRALATNVADTPAIGAFGQAIAVALGWDPDDLINISGPMSAEGVRADRLGGCSLLEPADRVLLEVLQQFFALVDTNEMELTEVHILWGVNPARAVSLPGDVQLVMLREAPPSLVRDLYLGVPERRNETPAELQQWSHDQKRPFFGDCDTGQFSEAVLRSQYSARRLSPKGSLTSHGS